MTEFEYNDCRLNWLHQWVLVTLAENNDRLYTVSDFDREWSQYDFISKSKLYRVCARLREAELVHTHREFNQHIEDSKAYQLNDDGRFYVSEMGHKLSRPPKFKLKKTVKEHEERISELERQMELQRKFNGENKEWINDINRKLDDKK